MKRTHLFFPEDLLKVLTEESVRTGAPVAELIRRAVREWSQLKGVKK